MIARVCDGDPTGDRDAPYGRGEPGLVCFDRRVQAFLGVLLLLLSLGTVFKLHGSSIGAWNGRLPDRRPDAGVLLGTPKGIRSDEWIFTTPAIISQASVLPAFSVTNQGWGSAQAPLISNLPVRHWSILVRPQFWGFFVLDIERGFAFYWNMKAFLLLTGMFLLLMLLTGNDFGVSLLGAVWMFFSGFIQWWYSAPGMLPEAVGCVALLLVAAHHLVLSSRRWVIAASALIFALCLLDFALSLYPPFQVPLFHLGIAILVGSLGPRLAMGLGRVNLGFRAGCAILAVSVAGVVLASYYSDARPAIDVMRSTVYPGSRISMGAELTWAQVFGGFYGAFISQESHPEAWGNVCEVSNFVLLFPVPMAALLWQAWHKRRVTALEWSLIVYLVVVFAWLTVRWPYALAVASGFAWTQGPRPLLGLGLASIILCCVFLAKRRVDLPDGSTARLFVAIPWLALLVAFALSAGRETGNFATGAQVALASLVPAGVGYLLLTRRRIAFAICVLVPNIWSNGLVNPIAVGLGPILDTELFREVSRIVERDPDARWTVYASYPRANFLKATGAQVFNGTQVVPPLEDLRVIDASPTAARTYNRFAHIELVPRKGSSVTFKLRGIDRYSIAISPMSDVWRRLGIRYVTLPFAPTSREFLAMTSLVLEQPDARMWVYEYRWIHAPKGAP